MHKIKIRNTSNHPTPSYATSGASGMDVRAFLEHQLSIAPMQRVMVPTGLFIALPDGTEMQVRPRSGLAWKHGLTVINSPGTIDADYRGELKILLINLSDTLQFIDNGDRIAQLVFADVAKAQWEDVDVLDETPRAQGGFGSTGIE